MRLDVNSLACMFIINNNPDKAADKAEDKYIQLLIFARQFLTIIKMRGLILERLEC